LEAGLYFSADVFEIYASCENANKSNTGSTGGSAAEAVTEAVWADSSTSELIELRLTASTEYDHSTASGSHTWKLEWGGHPGGAFNKTVSTAGWSASHNTSIRLTDFKVYFVKSSATWLVKWTDSEWYRDGVLDTTRSGPFSIAGIVPGPNGIPFLGAGIRVAGRAWPAIYPIPNHPVSDYGTWQSSCEAVGSWRFKIGATWYDPPSNVLTPSAPSVSCSLGAYPLPSISAATTYTAKVYASSDTGFIDLGSASTYYHKHAGGWVAPLVDVPQTIEKMGGDYGAAWIRHGCPHARQWSNANCNGVNTTDVTIMQSGWDTEGDYADEGGSSVDSVLTGHNIYAGYDVYGTHAYWYSDGVPANEIERSHDLEARFPDMDNPSDRVQAFKHTLKTMADYVNTHGWVHSLFHLYYPSDLDTTVDVWTVLSSGETMFDYWGKRREQYNDYPGLTTGSRRLKRNFIISEPLVDSDWGAEIKDWFPVGGWAKGSRTSPVGIWQFDYVDPVVPASYEYDSGSSSLWTLTDCTGVHGSDLQLTPTAGVDIVAELDLYSYTVEPYMLAQICEKFRIEWTATNIAGVNVYLVNAHGDKLLLTDTSSVTPVARPSGSEDHYAGSWGQDHGVSNVTDTGTDSDAAGESSTVMASVDRNIAAHLLAGYGAATLRYEIEVSDAGLDCNIDYPEIYPSTANCAVVQESGHHSAIVWPDAPLVRAGQTLHGRNAAWTITATPSIEKAGSDPGAGAKWDAIGALCWINYMMEGKAHDDSVQTDLEAIYDSTEMADGASMGTGSTAFVIDNNNEAGRYILVSSLRNYPPSTVCPYFERSTTTLVPSTTDFAFQTFSWCQASRHIVFRGEGVLQLVDPTDSSVWTTITPVVSGWKKASHDHVVDNEEGATFKVMGGAIQLALASPWHGYTLISSIAVNALGGVHMTSQPSQMFSAVYITDDEVHVRHFDEFGYSVDSLAVTPASSPSNAQILFMMDDRITVAYQRNDGGTDKVYTVQSEDFGQSWSAERLIIAGTEPSLSADQYGTEHCAIHDGAKWVLYTRRRDEPLFTLKGTIVTIGTASRGALEVDFNDDEAASMVFAYVDSGTVKLLESEDKGVSWVAGDVTNIGTGTVPAIAIDSQNAIYYCVMHDGTDLVCYRQRWRGGPWDAVGDVQLGVDEIRVGVEVFPSLNNMVCVLTNNETGLVRIESTDRATSWA
jgi:hypothetical protein